MTTAPTTSPTTTSSSPRFRTRSRALAVLGAVVAALTVWTVAGPVLGIDLQVQRRPGQLEAVNVGAVLGSSLVASLAGWATLAVLERLTRRTRTVWTILALAVLALSMVGPLAGGVTAGAKAALALMHLVVAAVLVPVLARTSDAR